MIQSQNVLERFKIADTNVKIGQYKQSNKKVRWVAYRHPVKRPTIWTRLAACDTEEEIRRFCAEWDLNIVEVEGQS